MGRPRRSLTIFTDDGSAKRRERVTDLDLSRFSCQVPHIQPAQSIPSTLRPGRATSACDPNRVTGMQGAASSATGVAYSTQDPYHFLNVRTGNMSAFPEIPDHFQTWLKNNEPLWRSLEPSFASLSYDSSSFLPRKIYGLYLKECLKKAQEIAVNKKIAIKLLQSEVLDLDHSNDLFSLTLDSQELQAHSVVLATSFPPSKNFRFENLSGYTQNIWSPPQESVLQESDLHQLDPKTHLVIIGSGLTMADAVMTLLTRRYRGTITLLSKHGSLSEPHGPPTEPYSAFVHLPTAPRTARGLFKLLRREVENSPHIDWRPIFDSLRPYTQALWKTLSVVEKKRFLRHLFSYWNRHRHRMPPASFETIQVAIERGQLHLYKGRFNSVIKGKNRPLQVIATLQSGEQKILDADYVLNCTGPDFSIKHSPFLLKLCQKELLISDDLGMGVRTPDDLPLYVLGSLLFGDKFETVAVPELRHQAAHLASTILANLPS